MSSPSLRWFKLSGRHPDETPCDHEGILQCPDDNLDCMAMGLKSEFLKIGDPVADIFSRRCMVQLTDFIDNAYLDMEAIFDMAEKGVNKQLTDADKSEIRDFRNVLIEEMVERKVNFYRDIYTRLYRSRQSEVAKENVHAVKEISDDENER